MILAVVQTNPVFGNSAANIDEAISLMSAHNADLFVLPELFNTGYNFADAAEAASLAEPVEGPAFRAMSKFARERSCYIAYGFAEQSVSNGAASGKLYNSAALVGPSGLVGLYRKIHLFSRENLFFAPGDLGFPVWDLPFGRVGMMVCFDWFFPESARTLALNGADIIAHPSNLVMPYCPDAMVTRCLENRVFAATANRVGAEDRAGSALSYIGNSEIVAHNGVILNRLPATSPGVALAEIDPALARNKNLNSFNHLFNNRHPEFYKM